MAISNQGGKVKLCHTAFCLTMIVENEFYCRQITLDIVNRGFEYVQTIKKCKLKESIVLHIHMVLAYR